MPAHQAGGAPFARGKPWPDDFALGCVLAVPGDLSDNFELRCVWRDSEEGYATEVQSRVVIDQRDMRWDRFVRVAGPPPPPFIEADAAMLALPEPTAYRAARREGFAWICKCGMKECVACGD